MERDEEDERNLLVNINAWEMCEEKVNNRFLWSGNGMEDDECLQFVK